MNDLEDSKKRHDADMEYTVQQLALASDELKHAG